MQNKQKNLNDNLYFAALKAINNLFSYTTVSQQQTLESLQFLAEEIRILIGAIEYDIEYDINKEMEI